MVVVVVVVVIVSGNNAILASPEGAVLIIIINYFVSYFQVDWDVERLRYNQFVKMLSARGGWEISYMERDNWNAKTPFRYGFVCII